MEKINFKNYQQSPEFIEGRQEFLDGRIAPPEPKKYAWYRKTVTGKEWGNDKYDDSKIILDIVRDGKSISEVTFAFLSTDPNNGCLEVSDYGELMTIQKHREATHHYPQPLEIEK